MPSQLQFQSNLMDQDSDMQDAMKEFDSFEDVSVPSQRPSRFKDFGDIWLVLNSSPQYRFHLRGLQIHCIPRPHDPILLLQRPKSTRQAV